MKKLLFVFNPNSGKGQIKYNLMKIIQIFSDKDYEVTVYPTKAVMDGYNYILNNQEKYDLVVCSGGDGTLNETVGAILHCEGKKAPIGYIPSGTTNDFAASMGIPKNMLKAAKNIVEGDIFKADIGMVNGDRNFNYIAAFGAFTEVSYCTPQAMKNVLGHPAYVIEGVKNLADVKPVFMHVKTDEKDFSGNFIYGMVSNTESVGGMKGLVGNGVDLQDGLFEVMLIRGWKNPLEFQQVINAILTQKFEECDMIYSFKTKHIEFESKEAVAWTLDGEFGGEHKAVCFDVMEKAVEFMVRQKKVDMYLTE